MAKKIVMSATRMSMFLQCKWKYWCNYVLHLPKKPNVSFKLGIAVHESLAKAGEIWKEKEKFTKKDVDEIRKMYNQVAAKEGLEDAGLYQDGLQMVMNRVNNFDSGGKILTVENRFNVSTNEGVMLMGAMDRVDELNDETILVTDYKTSKYVETASELKSDIQLSVYDVVASIKYPNYKRIILSLDYLRSEPVYTYRTLEQREGFMEYLLAVYNEMLKLKKEDAKPVLNDMCNWCDFTDNCTAYQEALSGKGFIKKSPEEYSDEELVKDYLDIKSRKRILDGREKELKDYIMRRIEAEGSDIFGQGKQLYIRQNAFVNYDPKTAFEIIPKEDLVNMVYMAKKDVDAYLARNPAVKKKLMETASKNYTTPFIAQKKITDK